MIYFRPDVSVKLACQYIFVPQLSFANICDNYICYILSDIENVGIADVLVIFIR